MVLKTLRITCGLETGTANFLCFRANLLNIYLNVGKQRWNVDQFGDYQTEHVLHSALFFLDVDYIEEASEKHLYRMKHPITRVQSRVADTSSFRIKHTRSNEGFCTVVVNISLHATLLSKSNIPLDKVLSL